MFVIFNSSLDRYFKHPAIGVWWTEDRDEAEVLLKNLQEIVEKMGLPEITDKLTIQEISELEEIKCS